MKKVILLLIVAGSCWQCKSTASDPTPAPTQPNSDLLVGKDWKLTRAVIDPAYDYFGQQRLINNIYAGLPICTLDDLYRYEKPNTFTISEGTNACPGNSLAGSYTWKLSNDETTLTQVFGASFSDNVYTIESVDANKLALKQIKVYYGNQYTLRFEYTKQ